MKVTEKKFLNVHQTISPLTATSSGSLSSSKYGSGSVGGNAGGHDLGAVAAAAASVAAGMEAAGAQFAGAVNAGMPAQTDIEAAKASDKLLVSPYAFRFTNGLDSSCPDFPSFQSFPQECRNAFFHHRGAQFPRFRTCCSR